MPNVAQQMNSIRQNYQQGDRVTLTPGNNLSGLEKAIVNSITNDTSNVKVLRSKEGQFLGVVDLNDKSRHVISDMDDLDINLGIIKPYEMSMLADPRGAQQLNKKRNWNNRGSILDSIYQSQFARPEPAKDDQRTSELFAKQTKGQQLDLEAERPVSTMARAARPEITVEKLPPPKVALTGPEYDAQQANMAFQTEQPPVDYAGIREQEAEQVEADRSREWSAGETAQLIADRPPTPVRRTNEQPFVAAAEADAAPGEATPVEEPAFVAPDPNAVNIQALPEPAQVLSEKPLDSFSPQEQKLLDYHRDNLFNNKYLRNEDGSVTTLDSITFEARDGRIYMIPGYDSESKQTLEFNDALSRALEVGLENFPSYETREQARQAEEDLHKVIELDMMKFERENPNMQVGGQVPQINRSGLIQGEGGPASDSIPMQAEPNSFIINAPAVQMAGGAKKLDNMVQQQQQTSGFNQFGNPVTGSQGINVSNGEYKVSQPAAKKIGYKKLNKMNNAGKPFVDQLDQKGYAEGSQVEVLKPNNPNPGGKYMKEMLIRLLLSEAGGEGEKGMQLVANIIDNRSKHGQGVVRGGGTEKNPAHLFDIISAGAENKAGNFIYEFEGFENKKFNNAKPSDSSWKVANKVVEKLLSGKLKDITGGNLFYRNDKTAAKTGWFQEEIDEGRLKKHTKIGNHTIYNYGKDFKLEPAPEYLSNRGFVAVEPKTPANTSDTVFVPPPPELPVAEPRVPANLSNRGFVNLPEEDYSEQQYREGLEEGDIIRGTLGVPESPYISPNENRLSENRLGRLPV